MSNTITSPQMGLQIPISSPAINADPGPDYANNINSALLIIDGHNHTAGNGAPVPVTALTSASITADLNFGTNYGLLASYFTAGSFRSSSAGRAAAGAVQLANTDTINFRNGANTADLPLSMQSDLLYFNGQQLAIAGGSGTYLPLTGGTMLGQLVSINGTNSAPGIAIGNAGTGFSQTNSSSESEIDISLNHVLIGAFLWNRLPGSNTGLTTSGTITSGQTTITALSSITNIAIGMLVSGANIPTTARVFSIDSATQVTFVAQSGATATANATETITFTDAGSAQVVLGTETLPMGISSTGGSISLNSSDWAVPMDCVVTGGNSFSDTVRIQGDTSMATGFGSGMVVTARSRGNAGDTMFFNEARFGKSVYTGNTVNGINQITSVSSTTNLTRGMSVSGTGIPFPTFIASISGSTITLSNAANATASGSSFNFYPTSGVIGADSGWFFGQKGTPGIIHTFYGKIDATEDSARIKLVTSSTSNPPTNAQLNSSSFGNAISTGAGFVGILDNGGAGTNVYFIWADGHGQYWYLAGSQAS